MKDYKLSEVKSIQRVAKELNIPWNTISYRIGKQLEYAYHYVKHDGHYFITPEGVKKLKELKEKK